MELVAAWLRAFIVTLLIEVPIVVGVTRGAGVPASQRLAIALGANVLTHPVVWFVIPRLGLVYDTQIWVSEIWAFAAEAVVYAIAFRALGAPKAAALSALANGASFGTGLLLYKYTALL